MSEVTIALATAGEVRDVQIRRRQDEAAVRLALAAAEGGRAWVARDEGTSIGLALAHDTPDERYVGEVFVEPSFRGQGIGAQLLDAALRDGGDLGRTVLVESDDRAGLALALRRSLAVQDTVLRVAGAMPREDALLAMAGGDYRFEVDAVNVAAHSFVLDALDRETRGTVRPLDHERFGREATGLGFFLNGEFVAYAYVWPDGRIGPLACASAAYIVQIFSYALAALQRAYGASWCTTLVPGSNVRLARAALRAGLQIEQTFAIAADTPGLNFAQYLGYHRLIF